MFPAKQNNKGTILIWTVLLGVMLTSVFFFLAMRLSGLGLSQRETMEYQNQKAYLESYVAYLMENPSEPDTTFDNIEVELTQNVSEITGVLDSQGEVEYGFSGTIIIDWNLCSDNNKGDMEVQGVIHVHDSASECSSSSAGHDDQESGVNVPDPFSIKAPNAPFHYKITPGLGTQLKDNKWHLEASMDLGYGKKIKIEKVF